MLGAHLYVNTKRNEYERRDLAAEQLQKCQSFVEPRWRALSSSLSTDMKAGASRMEDLARRLVEAATAEFQNCEHNFDEIDYEGGARGAVAAVLRELAQAQIDEHDAIFTRDFNAVKDWQPWAPGQLQRLADEIDRTP